MKTRYYCIQYSASNLARCIIHNIIAIPINSRHYKAVRNRRRKLEEYATTVDFRIDFLSRSPLHSRLEETSTHHSPLLPNLSNIPPPFSRMLYTRASDPRQLDSLLEPFPLPYNNDPRHSAAALAETLRFNTTLRGLSLARNHLKSASARAFGLLLAGGYEVLPAELEKRMVVEAKIKAYNKAAGQKKKKGARGGEPIQRLPLSTITPDADGKHIAGGSMSLAVLNLSENRELGNDGALEELFARIAEGRKKIRDAAEGLEAKSGKLSEGEVVVPLQELHVAGCQKYGYIEGEKTDSLAIAALALQPTRVTF